MVKIEDELEKVSPRSITVVEYPIEENQIKLVADYLEFKERIGSYGIYVSSNRPVNNLIEKVKDHGYDLKKALEEGRVWVVDLVSKSVGDCEISGVIYVSSASELSATQMAIERAINKIKRNDRQCWLLLDSITTMLVFNSPDSLLEFLHFLIGRLRVLGFNGVIFVVREGIEVKVVATIKQFCDKAIKL